MAEIRDWDIVAANNNDPAPDGWPEGMNYSDVNNAARENMAVIARWYADTNGSLVSTGAANIYALAPSRAFTTFADGMGFTFRADKTNTGNATVTVPVAGSASIKTQSDTELSVGAIQSGGVYTIVYNSSFSAFVLINDNLSALKDVSPNPAVTITGTANALIATPNGTAGALVDGLRIRGRILNDNTAAATLDYDGGGALSISNSSTGFLKAGLNCEFEYTAASNDWRILNSDLYWDDSIKEGFTISNAEITQIYQGTANSDADTTLTHPLAFPNVATYASGNFVSGGNLVSDAYFAVRNPTLTTVRVQSGAEDNETVRVIVRGY